MTEGQCFHCGQPNPPGLDLVLTIEGTERAMCCHGCEAVARAIVDNGLQDYYRYRTSLPATAEELVPEELRKLALYDHPDIQKSFVIDAGEHIREAVLILEGITCAACVWLNERHLMQLPGVKAVSVNYATHRARIAWDERQIELSKILSEIQLLGYDAHPFSTQSSEAARKKRRREDLRRLFVAGLFSAQVMMFAVALYAGDWYGMEPSTAQLLRWVSLVLSLPVVLYAAMPFYRGGWYGIRTLHLNMDTPVSIAIVSAFVGSSWATWNAAGPVYFDAATMFAFILLASRFLEQGARERSVEAAENLLKLAPAMATRVSDQNMELVPVMDLVAGDIILAKPGEAIAADAVVVEGNSSADEALLTGESKPVSKQEGDAVIAGSINLEGPLHLKVTGVGENTVLAGIVRLLDLAQAQKPRIAEMADRVAGHFTLALLLFATVVGIIWSVVDASRSFEIVLAVLVVTCPCALSIAAPAAIAAASSRLLRHGVLLTRGHALESLARVNRVVLDKTGTLTIGKPVLHKTIPLAQLDESSCLRIAASLQMVSEHPLAESFIAAAQPLNALLLSDSVKVPGRGVSGEIDGHRNYLGNVTLMPETCQAMAVLPDELPAGATVIWLGDDNAILATFILADELRPEARTMVERIRQSGLGLTILSGDDETAVAYVARQLGIEDYRFGQRPGDKLAALQTMQSKGEVVAMVGDGVNDAPVLGGAQVSIAMGSGTQVAQATSDIVLLSENLDDIWYAIKTSRDTMNIMKSNFVWAVGYNLIALPFAALGYMPPWAAAIGMSASSLIVVLNALRLR